MDKKLPKFVGTINIPGDKSISHRALIIGSQATGIVKVSNLLESADVFSTMNALRKFGVHIIKRGKDYHVYGLVVGGLREYNGTINCGNSGTTARLMMGLLSTYPITINFIGDKSLSKRPMARVINLLREFGANALPENKNTMPFKFLGSYIGLQNDQKLNVPSAQLKSAWCLAALNTKGISTLEERFETRDHTEIMLKYLNANIKVKKSKNKKIISIFGKTPIDAKDISVPGDISSAAFMIILALISKNSTVTIKNVLLNPTRTGILDVLKKMKAKIKIKNKKTICGEVVGDIEAKSSNLKATLVPEKIAPRLIDEYPILFIAACFAKGTSNFKGIEELRVKESDRIKSMEDGLKPLGVKISSTKSSVKITGTNSFKLNKKIKIDAKGDHRIAMSFYVLSQVLNKSFKIKDFNYVKTSFPSFTKTINQLKKN
ncbi:MAG: 3-phosphoshikimate 1-carboxyvinyltransferase [Pseudomonadota bacterium]|jgi:3-phosphoshikimate 1-carboxyvinyltransferase|nr:3-phosphoshikimate 1-carboxyvinyltransferase [Alphaproteobacteria bacterium]NBU54291.1 3-phosphoshikimate 1-carboxyvinyltransferase [Candidatus Fonsibacter sp. PEL3]